MSRSSMRSSPQHEPPHLSFPLLDAALFIQKVLESVSKGFLDLLNIRKSLRSGLLHEFLAEIVFAQKGAYIIR